MPRLILCSKSPLKENAVRAAVQSTLPGYALETFSDDTGLVEQPLNEGTLICANTRIDNALRAHCVLSPEDVVVAIESGIYYDTDDDGTVCHVREVAALVAVHGDGQRHVFYSFGITIQSAMFSNYLKQTTFLAELLGRRQTYGKYLENEIRNLMPFTGHFESDNWMNTHGGCDRFNQLKNALEKWIVHMHTDVVPDFPRPGVQFKDVTPVFADICVARIAMGVLKLGIRFYFKDIPDYFAGLDARGFYFAPSLASEYNCGFIPVRKRAKIPCTPANADRLVTEGYTTEYSEDAFGLLKRPEHAGKTVIIVDDLLATGGSIVAAARVLRKAGMLILGATTLYDVPALRKQANTKLAANAIPFFCAVDDVNYPSNDFF